MFKTHFPLLLSYVIDERECVYAQKYITYLRNVLKLIMNVVSKSKLPHAIFSIGLCVWSTHMWMFNYTARSILWRDELGAWNHWMYHTMFFTMVTRFWHHISTSSIVSFLVDPFIMWCFRELIWCKITFPQTLWAVLTRVETDVILQCYSESKGQIGNTRKNNVCLGTL